MKVRPVLSLSSPPQDYDREIIIRRLEIKIRFPFTSFLYFATRMTYTPIFYHIFRLPIVYSNGAKSIFHETQILQDETQKLQDDLCSSKFRKCCMLYPHFQHHKGHWHNKGSEKMWSKETHSFYNPVYPTSIWLMSSFFPRSNSYFIK